MGEEYETIFEHDGVRVEESRYPTGNIKVFDGDQKKKEFSKVLSDPTEKALNYAQGLVEGKKKLNMTNKNDEEGKYVEGKRGPLGKIAHWIFEHTKILK